jgi:hypothetical protein
LFEGGNGSGNENNLIRNSFKTKLIKYFDDMWNYLDVTGCLLFIIGISLRFLALNLNENIFIYGR